MDTPIRATRSARHSALRIHKFQIKFPLQIKLYLKFYFDLLST
jgi:hypothetical protein